MTCGQARKLFGDPKVRRWLESPAAAESGHGPLPQLAELRAHLASCAACARYLSLDRTVGTLLGCRVVHVATTDLAPAVLDAIRRRGRSSGTPAGRWSRLPMEWKAVPVAAGLCAGLIIGWFASSGSEESEHWFTRTDQDSIGQSLVSALVPLEPWGGEDQ